MCCADGTKAGVAEQVKNTVGRGSKTMSLHEARQVLGIKEEASWEEIVTVSVPFRDDCLVVSSETFYQSVCSSNLTWYRLRAATNCYR